LSRSILFSAYSKSGIDFEKHPSEEISKIFATKIVVSGTTGIIVSGTDASNEAPVQSGLPMRFDSKELW